MHGLTVANTHLDQVLKPITAQLDLCWWRVTSTGIYFPWIKPPKRIQAPRPAKPRRGSGRYSSESNWQDDPVDLERFRQQWAEAEIEHGRWIEYSHGECIGKRGFFSRYGGCLPGDWKLYFVSDAPTLPVNSFDEAAKRFGEVYFGAPPADLPSDIFLITRDVDHAYLDLFVRDEPIFRVLWNYLNEEGMNPKFYQLPAPEPKAKSNTRRS